MLMIISNKKFFLLSFVFSTILSAQTFTENVSIPVKNKVTIEPFASSKKQPSEEKPLDRGFSTEMMQQIIGFKNTLFTPRNFHFQQHPNTRLRT